MADEKKTPEFNLASVDPKKVVVLSQKEGNVAKKSTFDVDNEMGNKFNMQEWIWKNIDSFTIQDDKLNSFKLKEISGKKDLNVFDRGEIVILFVKK